MLRRLRRLAARWRSSLIRSGAAGNDRFLVRGSAFAALGERNGTLRRCSKEVRDDSAQHHASQAFLARRSVIALLALLTLPVSVYVAHARAQAAPPPSRDWARLSPFTDVIVHGDAATVQFDGQAYELVSIDDVPTKAILAIAKNTYGNLGEKRFVEDIVEVLEQLGRRPERNVKLVLRDAQSGAIKTVDRAPLTAENRRQVYLARNRLVLAALQHPPIPSSGYDLSHIVPFEVGASRLRDGDSITIVEVTGTSDRMTAGNMYMIRGTYKLASKEHATLLASVTANKRGEGQGVPTQKTQSVTVDQGNGHFSLILYMAYDGNPHISFYPAEGESFANVYFGTGGSVLRRGWWDKGSGHDARLRREPSDLGKPARELLSPSDQSNHLPSILHLSASNRQGALLCDSSRYLAC